MAWPDKPGPASNAHHPGRMGSDSCLGAFLFQVFVLNPFQDSKSVQTGYFNEHRTVLEMREN